MKDKDNIINIPVEKEVPNWISSTREPLQQLQDIKKHFPTFDASFKDYNYSDELANFLKGKTVVLVCPSPHLESQKMGKFIDSHDIVVRINQAYHMPEDKWEDYGKRTDVLMSCLNILKINALKKNLDFIKSLKFLIGANVLMWDFPRVYTFFKDYVTPVPWHATSDNYLFKIYNQIGTIGNTGLNSIIVLLNYDIKSLFVTGMTFYNMNKFGNIYESEYQKEASRNNNFRIDSNGLPDQRDLRFDIHAQLPQIEYFKKILKQHYKKRLFIDNYLKNSYHDIINNI